MCEENDFSFTVLSHGQRYKARHPQASDNTQNALTSTRWQNIPLKKKPHVKDIIYISALPQWLMANWHSPLLLNNSKSAEKTLQKITLEIVSYLQKNEFKPIISEPDHNLAQSLQPESDDCPLRLQLRAQFQIETQRPGWISFRLSNDGIRQWLEPLQASVPTDISWCELPPTHSAILVSTASSATQQQLWQAQYTHARCCSLLRQWQQYGLSPIHAAAGLKQAASPAEQLNNDLLRVLIDTTDDMFWIPYRFPSKQYLLLLKSTAQLCQAFEGFYSSQISGFGEISTITDEVARSHVLRQWQTKFSLIRATQNILEALLTQHLGAKAPTEL